MMKRRRLEQDGSLAKWEFQRHIDAYPDDRGHFEMIETQKGN